MYHLIRGEPEPQINPEKLTLYDFKYCPYCQRVRYTLDYHQIPYDRILINIADKPDWYLRLYPVGKVPFIRYRGEKLGESEAIMRFVDQLNGKPKTSLLRVCGEGAFMNALSLSEYLSGIHYAFAYYGGSAGDVKDFLDACGKIDATIKGPYLCGDKVSLADMALAPFFLGWKCVLQRIAVFTPENTEASIAATYPKLTAYRKLMAEEPYATVTGFDDDEYGRYLEMRRSRDPSTGRKFPWTVLVATKHPERLGFSSLRAWPCVGEPTASRQHMWGRYLDDGEVSSDRQPTLLVLAHSLTAGTDQTNCTGVPLPLPGIEKTAVEGISCLMPGCKHSLVSRRDSKPLNWPFCSEEGNLESIFYPSSNSAAFSALWMAFDPQDLLGLQTNSSDDKSALAERIGRLPYSLVKTLSSKDPPGLKKKMKSESQNSESSSSSSGSNFWRQVRYGARRVFNTSYTLHLLGRYFQTSRSELSPTLILIFALQLILLLFSAILQLPIFSPTSQRLCHIYHKSMGQLTLLSQTLQSKSLSSKYNGSCLALDPLIRNPRACSALEGPIQQSLTDVLNSFFAVAWGALQHGCVLELTASSTDHFASELNRLLIWLGSSEPAGWKINRNLAELMSRFFISHVVAWRVYVHFLIQIPSRAFEWVYAVFVINLHTDCFHLVILLLSGVFLEVMSNRARWRSVLVDLISSSTRLAAALIICVSLDILVLVTLHLSCFYVYVVRLFRVQLLAVAASWRLCRSGSKWNPLRGRVDTIPQNDDIPPVVANAVLVSSEEKEQEESETTYTPPEQSRHLDRVFVATFLGIATGLCLLPTTVAFYAVFSMIYIGLVCIKAVLTRMVCWILSFPIEAVVCWFFDAASIRTNLVITSPILDSVRVPFLTMKLVRGSLGNVIERSRLFDTKGLFGRRYSAGKVLKSLICANLLYPLSEDEN
ncbi:hypothetical protein Aperf_G00000119224 [Anoplocephala perfoliata]